MFAQHGGRECEGDSTKEGSCERVAELEREIEQLKNQKNALEEQLNCDISKCTITPYKKCPDVNLCGTRNGISCSYLPKGVGTTGCATEPGATMQKDMDQEWQELGHVITAGVNITGGCSALLKNAIMFANFTEVIHPGFTALLGKKELLKGSSIHSIALEQPLAMASFSVVNEFVHPSGSISIDKIVNY